MEIAMIVMFLAVFFAFLALGMRVAFVLAGTCLAIVFFSSDSSLSVMSIAQRTNSQLARAWPLLAIPLFIMVGEIFKFGLAERLVKMSNVFFGGTRGGLAFVTSVASFFFGGISGSAAAEAAAIGGVMIPAMKKAGYDPEFATAVTVTSSTLGPIVPPSLIMITFCWLTDGSIAALFAAGYLPGVLLCLSICLLSYYYAVKRGYPSHRRPPWKESLRLIGSALPALVLLIIIVGGILAGVFTATESAAVAVFYGLILELFFYRDLKWKHIPTVLMATAKMTGVVGLLIAFASAFGWLLTYLRVPLLFTEAVLGMHFSPALYMIIVVAAFAVLGCFLNPIAILLMTVPLLYPPAIKMGIHPLHFGLVTTIALAMGHITPPVGTTLFIGSVISDVPISKLILPIMPFIALMLAVTMILIFWPGAVLILPKLLGYA